MIFKEFKYQRPDFEAIKQTMQQHLEAIRSSQTIEQVLKYIREVYATQRQIQTMETLSSIRHSIDTTDDFYEQENAYWDEYGPLYGAILDEYYKTLLQSPFWEKLGDHVPKTLIKTIENQLKTFDPKIVPLLQEENRLSSEYSKLIASARLKFDGKTLNLSQMAPYSEHPDRTIRKAASDTVQSFFMDHEYQLDHIYDQLVQIRHSIAVELGFDTFIDVAYLRMNRFDYDETMVAFYRQQILDHVVPRVTQLFVRQVDRIGIDTLKNYDVNFKYSTGNAKPHFEPEELVRRAQIMYHELSPDTGQFMDMMVDKELMDLIAKPGKEAGGYMTFLADYKVPFIFSNFNGTSGDIDVLTHEAGHAFQGYQSSWIEFLEIMMPTYESCEIHSMSMEFLTWPWMELFFEHDADKYRFAHLSDALTFLPYGVLVDHFQHEIYRNPTMSPDERKQLWKELDAKYRPHLDFDGHEFAAKGTWWYRQGHIFSSPFYYIDYTLAQVCAFQFWKRAIIENDPKVLQDYLAICKIGGTQSFIEICQSAHIKSPFEPGCLESVINDIENWLDSVDDSQF